MHCWSCSWIVPGFCPPRSSAAVSGWISRRHRNRRAWPGWSGSGPEPHGRKALRAPGGAPLAALEGADRLATVAVLRRDLARVGSGDASPVAVAASWSKARAGIRAGVAGARGPVRTAAAGGQSGHVAWRHSRICAAAHGQPETVLLSRPHQSPACAGRGSFNVQLALEGLLIDWATGLRGRGGDLQLPAMHRMRAGD